MITLSRQQNIDIIVEMSQCIMIKCCNPVKLYWKTKHAIEGCGSTKKKMLFGVIWMPNGLYFTSKEWYWVFSLNYQLPTISWLWEWEVAL